MFGPRVIVPYLSEAIGVVDVPASICGEGARPPVELLELVRHVGEPHAEYEAWLRGDAFEFEEPHVRRL